MTADNQENPDVARPQYKVAPSSTRRAAALPNVTAASECRFFDRQTGALTGRNASVLVVASTQRRTSGVMCSAATLRGGYVTRVPPLGDLDFGGGGRGMVHQMHTR